MDPIIIEKGIPIPTKNSRKRELSKKYEFLHKMNLGDSVELKVLKAPYTKGDGSRANTLTYYGLMNAIHKAQKAVVQPHNNNFTIGSRTNNPRKKFTVRTIRLENFSKGMIRVMRVWRTA